MAKAYYKKLLTMYIILKSKIMSQAKFLSLNSMTLFKINANLVLIAHISEPQLNATSSIKKKISKL